MASWLEVLDTYTFDIEHRAGKRHGNADAMSLGLCRQCGDKQCQVRVVTQATKRKEEEEKKKDIPTNEEEQKKKDVPTNEEEQKKDAPTDEKEE